MEMIGILIAIILLLIANAFPYVIQRIQETKMLGNYPYLVPLWANIAGIVICFGLIIWLLIRRASIKRHNQRIEENKLDVLIQKLDALITVIKDWKKHGHDK